MNITLNTFNGYKNNNYQARPQHFGAKMTPVTQAAETVLEKVGQQTKSSFFKPFEQGYEKATSWIAQHFTKHLLDNKLFGKLAENLKDTNNLFQHCLTVGSVVTSGLYMYRTMSNKDLDEDRRNTLAVNQGLTLVVSTIGAYTLDKYMKDWWENVTAKYVGLQVQDAAFAKDFKDVKGVITSVNKSLKANKDANLLELAENAAKEIKASESVGKFVKNLINKVTKGGTEKITSLSKPNLNKFMDALIKDDRIPKATEELGKKIKGMGLLRSMIVFGFVYRFFVPVAVTKPANILCDKYLDYKKAKKAELNKNA